MPKFVIGFNIFDCRSLDLEDGVLKADIFLIVECCGLRFEPDPMEDMGGAFLVWNKKKIWSDIDLLDEEFQNAYIEFGVYTRNWFSRNYCVGKAVLQLKSINDRLNHVYAKKVIPLTKEGQTEAAGVITLTVYCLKENEPPPNETQVEDDAQNNPENDDLATAVCGEKVEGMTGEGRPHMVYIDIFKIENLPEIGWGQFPTPFITVEFGSNRVKVDGAPNVERYNFNTQCCLPVMTPVYEDTIFIKIWDSKLMGADVLLAQGMISFSELRNKPLPPRWFTLYGFDENEITSDEVRGIAREGEHILPNSYKGSLLMSGRVECLDSIADLQPANTTNTRTSAEPAQVQRTLLADVYEVCGAIGREAQLVLSVAKVGKETKWTVASWAEGESDDEEEEEDPNEVSEEATSFKFSPEAGRVEALSLMMPEDRDSRAQVMLNIFTRGVLSAKERIGWKMVPLHEIPRYEIGNPRRPSFYALNCMPSTVDQKTPASVLLCLEQHTSENVQRHNRKYVKPMPYIVRAYVFMAREIKAELPQPFGIRVSCAGTSKTTSFKSEVRPMWMEPVDMKITLNSNHKDEPPTMEPITVTLCISTGMGMKDVGKSICSYEYMRQKDSMSEWEAFKLAPQWIELTGGTYGTLVTAEVLVAFELLQRSARKELVPKLMWPAEEEDFDEGIHFCKLRKATLHFSLLGLRDLVQDQGRTKFLGDATPDVEVKVKKFSEAAAAPGSKISKYYELKFKYQELIDGGDKKNKEDFLQKWKTDALGRVGNTSYEFFQAGKVNVKLPDLMILEPFITIRVTSRWYQDNPMAGLVGDSQICVGENLQGEHRRCLNSLFPCSWYEGVDKFMDSQPNKGYDDQVPLIDKLMKAGQETVEPRPKFLEETSDARGTRLAEEKKESYELALKNPDAGVKRDLEVQKDTGPDGLPPAFHDYNATTNPIGLHKGDREKLKIGANFNKSAFRSLNYQVGANFSPRAGEKSKDKGSQGTDVIFGAYENTKVNPKCDFYFAGQPLLQNHDVIDPSDNTTDWNFEFKQCFGFVKCVFKLTDGWEGPVEIETNVEEKPADKAAALPAGAGAEPVEDGKPAWLKGVMAQVGLAAGGGQAEDPVAAAADHKNTHAVAEIQEEPVEVEAEEAMKTAELVPWPATQETLAIFPKHILMSLKKDFCRSHSQELYQSIIADPRYKAYDKPPKEKVAIRAWIWRVQQRMLDPLVKTQVQKELQRLGEDLQAVLDEFLKNSRSKHFKVFEAPLDALAARLAKQDPDSGNDSATYADFMRSECRNSIRSCRENVHDNEVSKKIELVAGRMIVLERLATSYGFERSINKWAFDSKTLYDQYKNVPTRLKCRLYFVKAICIFGKSYGSADPYIAFTIGQEPNSLRNQPCLGTNEPEFYRAEERDMVLPADSRLQIDLKDLGDVPGSGIVGKQDQFDSLIGSTVLDLEDRWHSANLTRSTNSSSVPHENRPLSIVQSNGKQTVTGSLQMWIEMIDSVEAADKKATPLSKPSPVEIELRFVIWTCENVKLVDNGKCDARVGITLQCDTYQGVHPMMQKTDTHHGSLGPAIFNWRIVYPKIVMPLKSSVVEIVLYDYNLIAGDTPIGSISLDIRKYIEKVASSMDVIIKRSQLQFKSPLEEDEGQNIGEVKFDMYVMPQVEANRKLAGIAREDPNENPQLMTPMEGRGWDSILPSFAFSLPSFGFYKKFIPLILFTLMCLVGLKYTGML